MTPMEEEPFWKKEAGEEERIGFEEGRADDEEEGRVEDALGIEVGIWSTDPKRKASTSITLAPSFLIVKVCGPSSARSWCQTTCWGEDEASETYGRRLEERSTEG
jgi:hypothetical protein